jgi:hypothetical protein
MTQLALRRTRSGYEVPEPGKLGWNVQGVDDDTRQWSNAVGRVSKSAEPSAG